MKMEFGNTNSKDIWENPLLCAQFLRGYSAMPLFAEVQPEDIEDCTEKFRPFVGVEYDGDAVKKIHLHLQENDRSEREVYVVALLEHKSGVDYDVSFQLLKYMVGIWNVYRNERNKETEYSSTHKAFRYPLIVPIVYYEGAERWTAGLHWRDRVEFSEMFGEYVPDFTYHVVELRDYSNEELLSKEEELSLVMMLNRVQTVEDLDISRWPLAEREIAERIIRRAPEAVLQLLTRMVHHMGLKLNLPDAELTKCVKNMEDLEMGELWANMEKMDIQAERRNTQEAREALEKVKQERDEAQQERDEAQQERDEVQQKCDEAQQERDEIRKELNEAQKEIAHLKQLLRDKKV